VTQAALWESIRFHCRHSWFNLREQFSDLPAGLVANALIPFFVWILSRMWLRFNSFQNNFTLNEVVIYLGITEVLFMTFVRASNISRATGDFSISLVRPRSWLAMSFSGLVGRSLGGRVFMLAVLLVTFPWLGAGFSEGLFAILRLILLLPWLGLMQGLFSQFFAIAQVRWHQTEYFLLPFGKIFLVLGGVWGPLVDFSEPWRSWLLLLPPSDLFFQPAYFCVKGHFYEMPSSHWFLRVSGLAILLVLLNIISFGAAKQKHQSFGG
jgi:hypothetical protein